jgi:diguanylate cyclase (GGDEF)-like protein
VNGLKKVLRAIDPQMKSETEWERNLKSRHQVICERTDKLFALLMCVQWPAAVLAAILVSPETWTGALHQVHPHLISAIYLGGLITIFPVFLAIYRPGTVSTRHTIAACQMLMSALLIHVTGGRIETHFHVFGSLAFLAFYMDWPVVMTATAVTLVDHVAMDWYAPASIFGTQLGSQERLLEHVLWVVFFDIFLVTSCVQSLRALRKVAMKEADQEILLYQAYHDSLTGLGNRLQIQKTMTDMLMDGKRQKQIFALMSIDLDKFKEVNDTLGHQVGDQVLTQASERLQEHIRKSDTLVRMGGDEFSIVLDECADISVAVRIGERIVASMRKPFFCSGHVVWVGCSIGICQHERQGFVSADLFHHADLALYKAKNNGRNCVAVFDEAMRAETLRLMSLEHKLRQAVVEKTMQLHYQPIVNPNGELLGFEALLRWHDPQHGNVSPGEFIPMAERTGLILPLGRWVLEQACRQGAAWERTGRAVRMSVNVSSLQLADEGFVTTVLGALKESGLTPGLLDLELTEGTLIRNHGQTMKTLDFLRTFGVKLSIDDFGTGYSSLSYLRELPVHTLKIDRAFMADIVHSAEARALVEGMVEMAHSLHLRVVAEGVETAEQMEILRLAGCDEIQGFHISKAVPAADANLLMVVRGEMTKESHEPEMMQDLVQAFAL